MTDLQKAELVMVWQAFKENKSGKSIGDGPRLKNCEEAINQILDILSSPDSK